MDIKTDVLAIIDDLFMEDVSDMMDEDLFDAGVLDSMGTVELIVELEKTGPKICQRRLSMAQFLYSGNDFIGSIPVITAKF